MTAFDSVLWATYARVYDRLTSHFPPYARLIEEVRTEVDAVAHGNALDVLDVGAGTGAMAIALSARGHQVTAVDSSHAMLARAARKVTDLPARPVMLVEHNVSEPLPFCDATFDAVVCAHVMYTLEDASGLLQEVRRVLRPAGCIVLVDADCPVRIWSTFRELWDARGPAGALADAWSLVPVATVNAVLNFRGTRGSYRFRSLEEWDELLQTARFRIESVHRTYLLDDSLMLRVRREA